MPLEYIQHMTKAKAEAQAAEERAEVHQKHAESPGHAGRQAGSFVMVLCALGGRVIHVHLGLRDGLRRSPLRLTTTLR